jgi:twitching motility two-component system response regulator PilG
MADLKGLKVMVIDDSGTITRAAEIYIAGRKEDPTGVIVKTVQNGFDAIPEIYKFMPHIIFLDVMMPRVEGFTICKAIKNNHTLKHIKVIMLTSKEGLFDRAKGVDAGADHYIIKPFQKDTILKVVSDFAPEEFRSR